MRDYKEEDFWDIKFPVHQKFWRTVADRANEVKEKWKKEQEAKGEEQEQPPVPA